MSANEADRFLVIHAVLLRAVVRFQSVVTQPYACYRHLVAHAYDAAVRREVTA